MFNYFKPNQKGILELTFITVSCVTLSIGCDKPGASTPSSPSTPGFTSSGQCFAQAPLASPSYQLNGLSCGDGAATGTGSNGTYSMGGIELYNFSINTAAAPATVTL